MGQRLTVTLHKGERDICNIYYHWGAYPFDSVMILNEIVQELAKMNTERADDREIQLAMIRFVERNGGGISGGKNNSEWGYVKMAFPEETFKSDKIDRNNRLIAISPEEICKLNNWADGVTDINLEAQEVTNWNVETQSLCNLKVEPRTLTVNPVSYGMDESSILAKEVSLAKVKETCFCYDEYIFVF